MKVKPINAFVVTYLSFTFEGNPYKVEALPKATSLNNYFYLCLLLKNSPPPCPNSWELNLVFHYMPIEFKGNPS